MFCFKTSYSFPPPRFYANLFTEQYIQYFLMADGGSTDSLWFCSPIREVKNEMSKVGDAHYCFRLRGCYFASKCFMIKI